MSWFHWIRGPQPDQSQPLPDMNGVQHEIRNAICGLRLVRRRILKGLQSGTLQGRTEIAKALLEMDDVAKRIEKAVEARCP